MNILSNIKNFVIIHEMKLDTNDIQHHFNDLVLNLIKKLEYGVGSVTFSGINLIMILLISYTVSALGSNLLATLILYYVEYVLRSKHADFFLLLYFVTGIIFLPGWIFLSHHFGKKSAWLAAMVLNTGAFIGVFFLGPGDATIYGILVFVSGIGFGATVAIPSAMQADVIDYDEFLSGERREDNTWAYGQFPKKLPPH